MLVIIPLLGQNSRENQLKKKGLFLLILSEVSFPGHLALLLWAGDITSSWWEYVVEEDCPSHGRWDAKKKRRKEPGSQYPIEGHTSNNPTSSHWAPPSNGFTTSQ
jgi:hypothetical protein